MYGVVELQGHQYKVSPGDIIDVDLLGEEEGKTINIDSVLFIGGDKPLVGMPTVPGAVIEAKVLRHDRSKKIIVFKRRPGFWRKRRGHRSEYTSLLITSINDGKGNTLNIDKNSKTAQQFLGKN